MELKNAFEGLTNRLGAAEEKISELEDMPTETSKNAYASVANAKQKPGVLYAFTLIK